MCLTTVDREEVGEIVAYKVFDGTNLPKDCFSGLYYDINGNHYINKRGCYKTGVKYEAMRNRIGDCPYVSGFHAYLDEDDAKRGLEGTWNANLSIQRVKLSGRLTFGKNGYDAVSGEFMEILEGD